MPKASHCVSWPQRGWLQSVKTLDLDPKAPKCTPATPYDTLSIPALEEKQPGIYWGKGASLEHEPAVFKGESKQYILFWGHGLNSG